MQHTDHVFSRKRKMILSRFTDTHTTWNIHFVWADPPTRRALAGRARRVFLQLLLYLNHTALGMKWVDCSQD
jgi:hypothetical protein